VDSLISFLPLQLALLLQGDIAIVLVGRAQLLVEDFVTPLRGAVVQFSPDVEIQLLEFSPL